jgi:hypothetical protein
MDAVARVLLQSGDARAAVLPARAQIRRVRAAVRVGDDPARRCCAARDRWVETARA